jgi:excisionase family DNA binding protein
MIGEDSKPRATALRQALEHTTEARPPPSDMLNVTEACAYLRISRWTLYRLIHGKQLTTVKVGRRRLVPMRSIQKLVSRLEAEDAA